jgi:DHA1 family multidrug resistance protein-like MFS transporter
MQTQMESFRSKLFGKIHLPAVTDRGVFFISISQFGMAFSFNCIMAFMPFYILRISPFGTRETMIWIGLIMGVSPAIAALTATFWGQVTTRLRPKLLFEGAILSNGLIMLVLGFIDNLYLILMLRVIQGCLGGASTIGLILISSISPRERLYKDMSFFQMAISIGQLLGPPAGAYITTLFGYKYPFILSFLSVSVLLVFCHRHVIDIPPRPRVQQLSTLPKQGILFGWILSFVATVHFTYLPSILPHILGDFRLTGKEALNTAGTMMMAYSAAAIPGNYLIFRMVSKIDLKKLIAFASISAALCQLILILCPDVVSFTVIRMLQVGMIAAVFPLIMSIFAVDAGGGTLGFLNSARFVGNALGPFLATSILAFSDLFTLYATIAGITVAALCPFLAATRKQQTSLSSDKPVAPD